MITYVIIAAILIILLLVLVSGAEKVMGKYGSVIARKLEGGYEKKKFFDLNNINNIALIIAFVFFLLSLMPELNRSLFLTISIVFVLRSLRGKMSFFRALWTLIGGFFLGVFISMSNIGAAAPGALIVALIVSVLFLIPGFSKGSKRKKA